MLEPNTQIHIILNAQQWNTVLLQLAEGPYRVVAPLMEAIQRQCQEHDPAVEQSNVTPIPYSR